MFSDRPPTPVHPAPNLSRKHPDPPPAVETRAAAQLERLQRVAERILGRQDLAQDAVQEALIALWRSGEAPSHLPAWLTRAVVHRSLHARRSEIRRLKWEALAAQEVRDECPLCDPERRLVSKELEALIRQELAALSEPQRRVLELRGQECLEYTEIARILGTPVGTVRSRLNRARDRLRSRVARHLRAEPGG